MKGQLHYRGYLAADGRKQPFHDIAACLKPELETIGGFISLERFQRLVDETKLLSLSLWRNEAALQAWRNVEHHRQAQAAGRGGALHDYGMKGRAEAPKESRTANG